LISANSQMSRQRRLISAVVLILLLAAAVPVAAAAAQVKPAVSVPAISAPGISAASSILMEAESGAVLYEKNADNKMLIASTTKMLTALVVLDRCDVGEKVTIGADFPAVEGSSMYLRPGETLTVLDLLYGLMLASGNDAAVALALHAAGSVEEFAALMNDYAAALGCSNSHFVNPHGLDAEGHYGSARDLALIARRAMTNEVFRTIVSTKYKAVAGRYLKNHNKLLWSCPGTLGIKTGYTKSAGRSLVSCAERGGMTLICVTLSAPGDWQDHAALYNWGFDTFRCVRISADIAPAQSVPVISGLKESAAIEPAESLTLVFRKDEDISLTWELKKFVYAPVLAGEKAGRAVIKKDGTEIRVVPLVYKEDVLLDETIPLRLLEKLKRRLTGQAAPVKPSG
jgi:D-alanyl-D-alanine carboxypeptidase (penicillin-binding protein 5/6)